MYISQNRNHRGNVLHSTCLAYTTISQYTNIIFMRVKGYHRLTSAHLLVSRNFYLHAINCLGISALLQALLPSPLTINLASVMRKLAYFCPEIMWPESTGLQHIDHSFTHGLWDSISGRNNSDFTLVSPLQNQQKKTPNKMRTYFPFLTTRRNSTVPEVFIPHHHIF